MKIKVFFDKKTFFTNTIEFYKKNCYNFKKMVSNFSFSFVYMIEGLQKRIYPTCQTYKENNYIG